MSVQGTQSMAHCFRSSWKDVACAPGYQNPVVGQLKGRRWKGNPTAAKKNKIKKYGVIVFSGTCNLEGDLEGDLSNME